MAAPLPILAKGQVMQTKPAITTPSLVLKQAPVIQEIIMLSLDQKRGLAILLPAKILSFEKAQDTIRLTEVIILFLGKVPVFLMMMETTILFLEMELV